MAELLMVTAAGTSAPGGGRDLLSRLLRDCLEAQFGEGFATALLSRQDASASRVDGLRGYLDGLDRTVVAGIVARIRAERIGRVFIDGSNLGRLAAAIKREVPSAQILTFFHNVEARFFLGSLRRERSVHAAGVMAANYVAERLAVRYSDRLITLSERDSAALRRLYGRGATDILPMAMADRLSGASADEALVGEDAPLLFVGGSFYANKDGIAWFAREVAPRLPIRTIVVGHGMDELRPAIEQEGKVEVVGGVDSLSPWYGDARVAIAPIFDGSGMKTKVAEALMFGKRIIGTREAFAGYEAIAGQAGWICETPDEFVAAVDEARALPIRRLDPALRAIYERDHSKAAMQARLGRILGSAAPGRVEAVTPSLAARP
jgi:glycosyltransferase involved in cell wall biosynthesis